MLVFVLVATPLLIGPLLVVPEGPAALFFVIPPLMVFLAVFGIGEPPHWWRPLATVAMVGAVFVAASYPIGTTRAADDTERCESRRPAGHDAIERCVEQRRQERWGPWQARGANRAVD